VNYGGHFEASGARGRGVYAIADNDGSDPDVENSENYGGYFVAAGKEGKGVYGLAQHTGSVTNYGGYFETAGVNGQAVRGVASNTGFGLNFGGYFETAGSIAAGVLGLNSNTGAKGALGNGEIGVWGQGAGTDNYAGYFAGNVLVEGEAIVNVVEITGGSDLSERFDIRSHDKDIKPIPGMLVSIDPDRPGDLAISRWAYDRKVAGIISGAGGVKTGMLMGQRGSLVDGSNPVALTGRVYCLADASNGTIEPGDLLTTSDTPGHAMKVLDYDRAQGAILGKSMTPLEKGRGLVLVLVSLQ
jgi:hypothetical protein